MSTAACFDKTYLPLSNEITKIISKLFGESGILASEDQVTFDKIRDKLTHSYDIPYLSNRLLPNLEQFE
jgi:hypothetical protein